MLKEYLEITEPTIMGLKDDCMKWYAFFDSKDSSTVNLLLDHNTTYQIGVDVGSRIDGSIDVLYSILESDTSDWNNNINNIRLISAEEVSEITGVSVPYGGKDYNPLPAEYSWIYNPGGSHGYITSTYSNDSRMMVNVDTSRSRMFSYYTRGDFGVRPVIEVNKDLFVSLITTTPMTYGSTYGYYGELPRLVRIGHTFAGWYTQAIGGTQVTSTTQVTNASDHTLYSQWTDSYANGEIVYFNPVTRAACSSSDYATSQSATGVKTGCMKWYAFLDYGGTTVNLILDHNTTGKIAWNTNSSGTTPDTANSQLASDVANWDASVKSTVRLITAEEIADYYIAEPRYGWAQWDAESYYNFHTGTQTIYTGDARSNTYAWLFDNTQNCTTYGCNKADTETLGYWTSSFEGSDLAWGVYLDGQLRTDYVNTSTVAGIRPVITVNRSLLDASI